jgi:hypothetical protein
MIVERIGIDMLLPVIERRAFMKLPLEERRRLLAEQAGKLADHHYAQDTEWRELEGGDLVEY